MQKEIFYHPDFGKYHYKDWVLGLRPDLDGFWAKWLSDHPESTEDAAYLKALLLEWNATQPLLSEMDDNLMWQKIDAETTNNGWGVWVKRISWAAVFAGIMMCGYLWLGKGGAPDMLVAKTGFGETKTIELSDGSTVTLNSNSSIIYPSNWPAGTTREVQLTGEAFFEVDEREVAGKYDKFIVRTSDAAVEVLGTRFNVNNRRATTEVALQSGKVRLSNTSEQKSTEVMLRPGEAAVFDKSNKNFKVEKADVSARSAWKERKLIFNQTKVEDMVQTIEDTYGFKVIIEDQEVALQKVTGEVPIHDKSVLLAALSKLYSLKIEEKPGNILILKKKNN
jgi:transmembrane sensor